LSWRSCCRPLATLVVAVVVATSGAVVSGASTRWLSSLASASGSESHSLTPKPKTATSACASTGKAKITLTWSAVAHATTYGVFEKKTGVTKGKVATPTTTTWTSATLTTTGTYLFRVTTSLSTKWASAASSTTAVRKITKSGNTYKCA